MDLDLINNIFNEVKNNKFVQNFIKELQNYLERGEMPLINSVQKDNQFITQYRDKMYLERNNILNNYANQTPDKGEMYYIYSQNSKMENDYNLCACSEGNSNNVIEVNAEELPKGVEVGSILRKIDNNYILDVEATGVISNEIEQMKNELMEEQNEFLRSKRIEGHIYELSEKSDDRVWLFDITSESSGVSESIEEIEFPGELLDNAEEGDMFVFENGQYKIRI